MYDHPFRAERLAAQRKQALLREAEVSRLLERGQNRRPGSGVIGRVLLRAGDLLIALGRVLKARYAPQHHTSSLEVK